MSRTVTLIHVCSKNTGVIYLAVYYSPIYCRLKEIKEPYRIDSYTGESMVYSK